MLKVWTTKSSLEVPWCRRIYNKMLIGRVTTDPHDLWWRSTKEINLRPIQEMCTTRFICPIYGVKAKHLTTIRTGWVSRMTTSRHSVTFAKWETTRPIRSSRWRKPRIQILDLLVIDSSWCMQTCNCRCRPPRTTAECLEKAIRAITLDLVSSSARCHRVMPNCFSSTSITSMWDRVKTSSCMDSKSHWTRWTRSLQGMWTDVHSWLILASNSQSIWTCTIKHLRPTQGHRRTLLWTRCHPTRTKELKTISSRA